MRLVCPSCQSAYDVPEARFSGHTAQRFRCARCGHVWSFTAPPVADPPPLRSTVPLPGVPSRGPETDRVRPVTFPPPRQAPGRGPLAGWVLSVALLAFLGYAAWHWRQPVMKAWPPSERVYRLLGGA